VTVIPRMERKEVKRLGERSGDVKDGKMLKSSGF
jgi:hypothetical protein